MTTICSLVATVSTRTEARCSTLSGVSDTARGALKSQPRDLFVNRVEQKLQCGETLLPINDRATHQCPGGVGFLLQYDRSQEVSGAMVVT